MATIKIKKIRKESLLLEKGKYYPMIRSRHPSHSGLRRALSKLNFRSVIRFGSSTVIEDNIKRVELNSIEAIANSSSKLKMKKCFSEHNVKTAEWIQYSDIEQLNEFIKSIKHSNFLIT